MRIRYLDWKQGAQRFMDRMKALERVFSFLLVREDGDVERALEILEWVGDRHGLFDDELTFEKVKEKLIQERLIQQGRDGGLTLTPRGERFVRMQALDQIFTSLKAGVRGDHRTAHTGPGAERLAETRPYRFGDEVSNIDFSRSFQNAFTRLGHGSASLTEDDLEVFETENYTSVATVVLLDISHSMTLYGEDRITPAKRVALGLAELILTRYPKDDLHVILFGDDAHEVSVRDLTYASNGPYHTNTHAGLQRARRILMRKKHTNKQIFMITDGKPTALMEQGELYLNAFGLDRKIVAKTLDEAAECRRHGIGITTFMLAREPLLVQFVENLTRINQGRAFFASADHLEQTVFVDFVRNRQRRFR